MSTSTPTRSRPAPGQTWEALLVAVERSFGGAGVARVARLLGCEDENGFHVASVFPL